jgi:hypothetical protein
MTTIITPKVVPDLEALEAKRKKLLAESKHIVKGTSSVHEDKMEAERLIEQAKENERLAEEELVRAKELAEEWKITVNETHEEARKMRREAIRPRNINFDSAARHKPPETPKENMKMAAELLAKSNDQIDIENLRTIIATTMKQQSKADTSRRLEHDPEACVSTTQKNPTEKSRERRDDQSRTESTKRRKNQ